MGSHSKEPHVGTGQKIQGLHTVRLTVYTVVGQTAITAHGLTVVEGKQANVGLGGLKVGYPMLELPAVGQLFYALGDELKRNWAHFGKA